MLRLSVIIPTLQEGATIGRLLRALSRQTYRGPVEVIVVDGGSSDATAAIARGYGATVRTTSRGTAAQRNLGARAATGDLLLFMDADTRPDPAFLQRVAGTYRRRPFAVACPWFVADSQRAALRVVYFGFNLLFTLSQWRFHTGSGVCILTPREVFARLGGFNPDLHLGEDADFIRRAATLGRHRHLTVPLRTSARRFEHFGIWPMLRFYVRITPALLKGDSAALQRIPYPAAPYK